MLLIKDYSEEIRKKWDEYAIGKSNSNFFHLISWKMVIEKTFGIKSSYIYAENENKVVGILPLFCVKNIFMKKTLISVPFGVYGGCCADSYEIEVALIEKAKKLTVDGKVNYLELRYLNPRELGLKEKNLYYSFVLELSDDPNICWTNMRKKARNIIRKGMKGGLEVRQDPNDLRGFYDLFSISQQNLGTPVLPFSLFENIMEEYKGEVTIFSTFQNNVKINSLLVFFFKDLVMPYYIGYKKEYLRLSPNNFLLWKVIEFSCENGYRYYDLGRSREGSGSFSFKKNMGTEPQPLHYQYFLNLETSIPNISPSNKKFSVVQNTWQKIPPSLARALGPKIVRYFP